MALKSLLSYIAGKFYSPSGDKKDKRIIQSKIDSDLLIRELRKVGLTYWSFRDYDFSKRNGHRNIRTEISLAISNFPALLMKYPQLGEDCVRSTRVLIGLPQFNEIKKLGDKQEVVLENLAQIAYDRIKRDSENSQTL